MATSVTVDVSRASLIGPVTDAIDTILDSTVVPIATRRAVTRKMTLDSGGRPAQIIVTFPDETGADQIANFTRRAVIQSALLKGVAEQFPYSVAPAGQTY